MREAGLRSDPPSSRPTAASTGAGLCREKRSHDTVLPAGAAFDAPAPSAHDLLMGPGDLESIMKAIRVASFGEPDVLRLVDVSNPTPARGQVLVRISAAGVNPVEAYIRSGIYGPIPLPYTPGSDGAGVVESVGPEVTGLTPGDRVYTSGSVTGTYAEMALVNHENVHKLPERITFAQGAALGIPYGTAYRALFVRGAAKAGQSVLVHGASGGVGLAAVQFARAAGLRVIGTAGSADGRKLVLEQGAHHVLDHTAPGYLDQIGAFTRGHGVDLILELLANVNLDKDLGVLAANGVVVVIGSRGRVEIDPRQTMARNADIRGMTLRGAGPAELIQIHAAIRAGLENATLHPVIDEEIPLAEAARAHREIMQNGSRGKIVLVP